MSNSRIGLLKVDPGTSHNAHDGLGCGAYSNDESKDHKTRCCAQFAIDPNTPKGSDRNLHRDFDTQGRIARSQLPHALNFFARHRLRFPTTASPQKDKRDKPGQSDATTGAGASGIHFRGRPGSRRAWKDRTTIDAAFVSDNVDRKG